MRFNGFRSSQDNIVLRDILEIRHAIPGRIRFRARPIRHNRAAADRAEAKIREIEGVIWTRANLRCGSLAIGYSKDRLAEDALICSLRDHFAPKATVSPEKNGCACSAPGHHGGVRSGLAWFSGMTAVTGAVFVQESLLGLTVAQTLLSPLGIITALAAVPLVIRGLKSIRERRFTLESFLGATIVAAVAAGEAVAALEILWITSGADLLTAWITERSRRAVRDILDVTAKNTYILVEGVEVEVPVDQVEPGDIVAIHTGEKISVDGVIADGEAVVDESPINGRAELAARAEGNTVFAGTFVREGVIHVRAEKVGDRTYLSRILRMVEDSLENKAPIEGAAEDLARKLIRVGFATTFGTLLITGSLWRAFTVMLVMACPCATVLAASTAISAALNAAARRHILIKGGRYLEEVGTADVVCFDKTGTLTTNQPEIRAMFNVDGVTADDLILLACTAEKHNSHPLAHAIRAEAERRDIQPIPHDVCEFFLGRGVRSEARGEEILVGNAKLMRQFDISISPVNAAYEEFYAQGLTSVFVAKDGKILGAIAVANQNRPDVVRIVRRIQQDGTEIAMITGDEKCSAMNLTAQLNISECHYSVMPEEKSDIVRAMKAKGKKVLMVGDGINDALALAEADVGIAMGAGGSEVAIEAADIALVRDELTGVVYVRSLSRETMRIVRQNFWIATGTNLGGVVLGALGVLSPVMAGMIHIVHTAGILANSGRLLFYKAPPLPGISASAEEAGSEPEAMSDSNILYLNNLRKIA
ncbi:heavy metal translocating P-type ATPase [Desulfonema ishimotonii]|uniref:P-type Zn(2+) transporter n=2 Tax=Desulfonema ishimotonii TaxID=45657 RepID=A0A401G2Q9_9BACT|nr:heavy metal translocating P-type ATPase [Desulfonema ishimotonii]